MINLFNEYLIVGISEDNKLCSIDTVTNEKKKHEKLLHQQTNLLGCPKSS